MKTLTQDAADRFAAEWVAAWNAHDLDRVLSHYAEEFSMTSPYIIAFMGEPSGTLQGKEKVRHYWETALGRVPSLHFELLQVLVGVDSVTLYYRNQVGRFTAEVLRFNAEGQVAAGSAHYADAP